MGCSRQGSCVRGILQTRILEWVALPFSRESSQPFLPPGGLPDPEIEAWSPALQEDSLLSESPGKPRPGAKGHQKECDCSLGASARLSFIPVLQQLSQATPSKDTWDFLETFLIVTTGGGGDVL